MRTKLRLQTGCLDQLRIGDRLICVLDGYHDLEVADGADCQQVAEAIDRLVRQHGVVGRMVSRSDDEVVLETPLGVEVRLPLESIVLVATSER